MNVPDRPRSPDGCDDDAIFADIVAHLNDDVPVAEPTAITAADQVATDIGPAGETTRSAEESVRPTDVAAGSAREGAGGTADTEGSGQDAEGPGQDATGSAEDAAGTAADAADEPAGRPPGAWPRGEPAQWPMNPWPRNPWPISQPPEPAGHSDPPAPPAAQAWRAHEVPDEDEEHFEPPPVTPLPAGDLAFWGILVGMGGGPLLLLYLIFFNPDAGYWILTAIAMFIGGFVTLVSRMPGHHEDDDDGARL